MKNSPLLCLLTLASVLGCSDNKKEVAQAIHQSSSKSSQRFGIQRFVAVIPDNEWDVEQLREAEWPNLLSPHHVVRATGKDSLVESWVVVMAEFDKEGRLISANREGRPQNSRLDGGAIVVSAADKKSSLSGYEFGRWVKDLVDTGAGWAAGLCEQNELMSPSYKTDAFYVYEPSVNPLSITFRCREWTYQLLDKDQPYINVTSYVPRDATWSAGAYVRKFVGWYGFGAKKPVVGKHEREWYCFLDCPNGEAPGPIADIQVWADRNGWHVPRCLNKSDRPPPDANGNILPDHRDEDDCPGDDAVQDN